MSGPGLLLLWPKFSRSAVETPTQLSVIQSIFGDDVTDQENSESSLHACEWSVDPSDDKSGMRKSSTTKHWLERLETVRSIVRDEVFVAEQSSRRASGINLRSRRDRNQLSIQFISQFESDENVPDVVLQLDKKVQWGNVNVIDYDTESEETDPAIQEKVTQIQELYETTEMEVVYHMLFDEFSKPSVLVRVFPTSKKEFRHICVREDCIRIGSSTKVELLIPIVSIRYVSFGNGSSDFRNLIEKCEDPKKYPDPARSLVIHYDELRNSEENVSIIPLDSSSKRCGETECTQTCLSLICYSEAHRNSLGLLLRLLTRLVIFHEKPETQSWSDALDSDSGDFFYKSLETIESDDEWESKGVVQLNVIRFCRGVNAIKVTNKGGQLSRKVLIVGPNLRIFSEKQQRGQMFHVTRDVVKVTSDSNCESFRLLLTKSDTPLDETKCAVVHLVSNTCCLLFESTEDRDDFVSILRSMIST